MITKIDNQPTLIWKLMNTTTQENPDEFNIDELFDAALEHMAAEKEVTVDYYIAEFLI